MGKKERIEEGSCIVVSKGLTKPGCMYHVSRCGLEVVVRHSKDTRKEINSYHVSA